MQIKDLTQCRTMPESFINLTQMVQRLLFPVREQQQEILAFIKQHAECFKYVELISNVWIFLKKRYFIDIVYFLIRCTLGHMKLMPCESKEKLGGAVAQW